MSKINRLVSVAPMMDCTDRHERYFLRLISKHVLLYTEMVVSEAIDRGDKDKLLSFDLREKPVALQLGGSTPKLLANAAKIGEDYGYDEINLNLGCPSKKVQKNRFGACLIKEPNLVADCLSEMINSTSLPVTVKTRIGYDDVEDYEHFFNFIKTLKETGVKTFIIHARKAMLGKFTPKQNLNIPPLKYDYVYKLMIGRSVYHSPYLLADIEKEIFNNSDIKEREEIVEELIDYVKAQVQMGTRVNQVMRHTLGLFHGQTGSSHWKRYLSENMCVRDADVKKIDHIMDKVRLSPKLHSAGRID